MPSIYTIERSSFSSDSSLDFPLSPSQSLKRYTRKVSNLFTPGSRTADDDTEVAYSANTTPPLDKSFAVTSPMSASGRRRAVSGGRRALAAFKESWKAGIDRKGYEQERNFQETEDAEGKGRHAPRYAPITELQQAEDRRRAERDASLLAPGRTEYLFYVREHMGQPVEHETIIETMWSRPCDARIFKAFALLEGEGEDARCFF